jgi:Ni2+-binding GTPase involved in maturation of urease and hydrogenase
LQSFDSLPVRATAACAFLMLVQQATPLIDCIIEIIEHRLRGQRPFVFTNMRAGQGIDDITRFIKRKGGM